MATPLSENLVETADEGDGAPTAGQIAAVLSGIGSIGGACNALRAAGWKSTIAGNRITVDDRVFVRFLGEAVGLEVHPSPRWVVYGTSQRPAVWVLGAQAIAE